MFCTVEPRNVFLRHSNIYQSLRRQPTPSAPSCNKGHPWSRYDGMHPASSGREIKRAACNKAISTSEKRVREINWAFVTEQLARSRNVWEFCQRSSNSQVEWEPWCYNTVVGALTFYDYKFHEIVGSRFKSGCVEQGKQRHNWNVETHECRIYYSFWRYICGTLYH